MLNLVVRKETARGQKVNDGFIDCRDRTTLRHFSFLVRYQTISVCVLPTEWEISLKKKNIRISYKLVEFLQLMVAFIQETEQKTPLAKLWKHSLDFICTCLLLIFLLILLGWYIITYISRDLGAFIYRIGQLTLEDTGSKIIRNVGTVHQSTWMNIPEDVPLRKHRFEHLRYCCFKMCCCHFQFYWLCSILKEINKSCGTRVNTYLEGGGGKFYIKDNVVGYVWRLCVKCFEYRQLFCRRISALSLGDPYF